MRRLVVPAIALGLAACKGGGGPEGGKGPEGKDQANKGPEAIPVEVAKASNRSIAASYAGTAPLEARGEAQVVAKTSGIALQVYADIGQQVRAGQPLVRIDRDRATLQVAQADAEVRKLEANYRRSAQLLCHPVDLLYGSVQDALLMIKSAKEPLLSGLHIRPFGLPLFPIGIGGKRVSGFGNVLPRRVGAIGHGILPRPFRRPCHAWDRR